MSADNFTPPFPTDTGGASSPDVPPQANFTAAGELQETLDWSKGKVDDLAGHLKSVWDKSHILEDIISVGITGWAWYCKVVLEWELDFDDKIFDLEKQVMLKILPTAQAHGNDLALTFIDTLAQVMVGDPGPTHNFGNGKMAPAAKELFNVLGNRFSLITNGANPAVRGSGIQNQQYLVSQVTGMALNEWAMDWASQHLGLGVLKDLQPIRNVLDEVVNTRNVVRQANNAAYATLLHAPLTRDLNRAYPVKTLGLTALAKLYTRGAITQADFFDRCLDSGIDATQAQQLVLESVKLLSSSQLGDLVNHGFISNDDALQVLLQSGYQLGDATALMYIETHQRLWSIQERVGNAAVAAWTKKRITKDRLEEILAQCGFTTEEITLLEIEQEFAKHVATKDLTYAEVKSLFTANIIGIDDVITFLDAQGFAPADRNNLVLLDFTKLEERQTRLSLLIAKDRVQAQQDLVDATAEDAKQETDLAKAKRALASALNDQAKVLGNLQSLPAITKIL